MTATLAAAVDQLAEEPAATALLLDYDGTLAPIVSDPRDAVAFDDAPKLLRALAERLGVVAVVSGRPVGFLLERLGPPAAVRLFGLYGLERARANGTVELIEHAAPDEALIAELADEARAALPDADVENKLSALTLHWRRHPEHEAALIELADRLVAGRPLVARRGKMSIEVVGENAPDKGLVVRDLGAARRCCAYFGDDLGDLPAFGALDELADTGVTTLRIAVSGPELPDELARRADLVLNGQKEVRALLEQLARRIGAATT